MLRLQRPLIQCLANRRTLAFGQMQNSLSTTATDGTTDVANWKDIKSYKWFLPIQTRWKDNDQYGHVNNAVYQSYFDSVVNVYLIRHCGLNPAAPPPLPGADLVDASGHDHSIAFIVECYNQFFAPILHPHVYMIGLSVSHLGNSSIRYRLGLFQFNEEKDDEDIPLDLVRGYFSSEMEKKGLMARINSNALAAGTFVHVVVDSRTQNPSKIPSRWREHLGRITVS